MNVLVTGGGTAAPIDDVRSITNASTGRFSAAITEACLARGATVQHLHAPGAELPFRRSARLDLDRPFGGELARLEALGVRYRAARERLQLVPVCPPTVANYATALAKACQSSTVDLIFLAMAVSDYEPEPIAGKIESSNDSLTVRCRKSPKVIMMVRDWSPTSYIVGFKLLSGSTREELVRRATLACIEARTDATVANDLSTIREGRHEVILVRPGEPPETFGSGPEMADAMVARVMGLAAGRR